MSRIQSISLLIMLLAIGSAHAQSPTGTIAGVVTDSNAARIGGARITVTNRDTRLARNITTSREGDFSAAALPSGVYTVTAEANGFRRLQRTATAEAGTTTTVNLTLEIGQVIEQMTIDDASPLINFESHQVGGVVSRTQIENLPLNGRNFLDLAKLEPGVANPVRATNNRILVPLLGAGLQNTPRIGYTRVTVDGADINFVGALGASLQVSQEAVQEFQLATVNFDLATSVTSDGAVNIVTRSGGKELHGSGFYFYRDHNLSAYPGLSRDASNPDPFFQRKQFGYQIGGPIRKDRAFFFTSYERNDQQGVLSFQPLTSDFAPLGGIFPSPYLGSQFDLRLDGRLNRNHNALVRYTHDANSLFGPNDGRNNSLPSGWSRINNWVDQSLLALTSVLATNVVNDLRFSYFFLSTPEIPATSESCPGCLGAGAPRITIPDAGLNLGQARSLSVVGRRYQLTDGVVWQRHNHRLRFGFDWEHTASSGQGITADPASLNLYSPREVRQFNATVPPAAQIPLPASFLTFDDIMRLPLRSFSTGVGPGQDLQRDFRKDRIIDFYRLYAGDTWRLSSRLTINYGVAWSYEPNTLNTDLTKPKLLIPILGLTGLNPSAVQILNFSPTLGFAWTATSDGKTVIRGGAGRYYDPISFSAGGLSNERQALFPLGTGRKVIPGSAINDRQGRALQFTQKPTTFTGANLFTMLPGVRVYLLTTLDPHNRDFTFRNIDQDKAGSNLSDPFYQTPYGLHFSLGVQRELARNLVLTADFAWRKFLHTFISGIDYNRFESARGPVIQLCTPAQQNDLTCLCSSGPITFDNTTGIAQYKGLLVRLEKRLSHRAQFLASYAVGSYKGSNGAAGPGVVATGFNNNNWFENYGPLPTDIRHTLNLSGVIDLPAGFQVSFNVAAYSRPPFSAFVSGIDFNGDGTSSDLLPGSRVNQFNRGLNKADLARLVAAYNQQFAGRLLPNRQPAPTLTLPSNYSFNTNFFAQDLRLSRSFRLRGEHLQLLLLGEVFNLFNTANLVQYSGNLGDPSAFGQPGARFSQVFGSGGPRAFQFGARLRF